MALSSRRTGTRARTAQDSVGEDRRCAKGSHHRSEKHPGRSRIRRPCQGLGARRDADRRAAPDRLRPPAEARRRVRILRRPCGSRGCHERALCPGSGDKAGARRTGDPACAVRCMEGLQAGGSGAGILAREHGARRVRGRSGAAVLRQRGPDFGRNAVQGSAGRLRGGVERHAYAFVLSRTPAGHPARIGRTR